MALDTVAIAQTTPDNSQPFAELGLKPDEYARIKEILGRRPTSSELAMYSVMWSEHCSYKSSKVHLKQFGEKGDKFDPELHNALVQTPSASVTDTRIADVVEYGFQVGDRLLRPAMVAVFIPAEDNAPEAE